LTIEKGVEAMVGRREMAERRLSDAQGDRRERERWREPLAGDELENGSATAQCASSTTGRHVHSFHWSGTSLVPRSSLSR
jgi:hypothetical protein